ncbi:MAG TPA: NBR1-Ig-like domain-containing protein [Anaerolineales bacterium]|nr:NBR1-Ig-like domain-containing protein [Anaerolineales bacterium]
MIKRDFLIILFVLCIPAALLGCGAKTPASPTTNPNLIYTAAAQTADARLTQIFLSTPSVTPTPPTPTFDFVQTMAAGTASALLTQAATQMPSPQATASSTSAGPGPGSDKAVFVADVTIPDGTVLAPKATFTKTWKLQNSGTSTWTTSYTLEFMNGEQMGSVVSVPISTSVAPGAQIDISVNMVAPTNPGSYQSNWKMKNASGQFFNDPVYVLITVGSSSTAVPTSTGTQGATPTNTGIPANPITAISMSVDPDTFNGQCPYTFNFIAKFTLSQGATLTYGLEAGSETPGFQFNLPSPVTSAFGPGTYSLTFPMEFTDSVTGWVRFHVTSPVDTRSNQTNFTLTCTP